jgi:hypothetical protein
VVKAKLPERMGELEYHIKHINESYERMREKASSMWPADDARQNA